MLKDKNSGILLGLAVGDALGVPHEFRFQKANVYTGLLYIAPKITFRYSSRQDVIGQYSDDTEMTLYNVRSIVNIGKYDRRDIIKSYQEWANSAKAIGKNTRELFKGVKTIGGYEKRWTKKFSDPETKDKCQSNGALMRSSMLALLCDDSVIRGDVKLTNPNKVCIDAELCYAECIRRTVKGQSPKEILTKLKEEKYCKQVQYVIDQVLLKQDRDVKAIGKGWVVHNLYCALWAWYYYDSWQDGIDYIIRLGGDTDTNGAVAGALLGAKLGLNSMLKEDRTKKNIEIVRAADFDKGDYPRPEKCLLKDMDMLIEKYVTLVEKNFE